MITATEAMRLSMAASETKITQAKMIAEDTIDAIEAIIKCDAKEGKIESTFHLYNYHDFNSETEKRAYRNHLKEILETNGYTVKYNSIGESFTIRFY